MCVCLWSLVFGGIFSQWGRHRGWGCLAPLSVCGLAGALGNCFGVRECCALGRRMAQGRTREVNALTALPVQLSGHFWMTSVIAVGTLRYPVVAWRRECRSSGSWLRRGVSVTEDPDPRLESAGGHVVGSSHLNDSSTRRSPLHSGPPRPPSFPPLLFRSVGH